MDAKEQAEKRPFEHYLISRFTSFRSILHKTITTLYKELSENQLRNTMIADDVVKALNEGRTPIILTERREHIETLKALLTDKCDNIITLFGNTSQQKIIRDSLLLHNPGFFALFYSHHILVRRAYFLAIKKHITFHTF